MPSNRRSFYVALAVLMTALVFLGFWPSYFRPLFGEGEFDRHWIFHVHSVVFLGWMAAFIGQTTLVARRRTKLHMKMGTGGFLWSVLVFALGIVVSFVGIFGLFDRGIVDSWPEALWRTSAPLADITQFAILVTLGWTYRRKPDFHKRYMVLATMAILPAATGRMGYLLGPWSLELIFVVLAATLLTYDLRSRGRVHVASVVGLLILLPRVVLNISYKFI